MEESYTNPRKRVNAVSMEEQYRGMDDIMVVTPPNATRIPARLRLSVSRKERPAYDSVSYEEVQEEDGTRRQLLNSDSRKERFAYNDSLHNSDQMHEVDIRSHLSSRSSYRKDRLLCDPEIDEDSGSRRQLPRASSRKDRPIYSLENREEGSRRQQLSRSFHRKDRSTADLGVEEPDGSRKELLDYDADVQENGMEDFQLSERRRALFEPLGPTLWGPRDGSPQSTLPPPDFDFFSYPRGWVVGKRRKLVNVDVVESMRHIAVQEMNRKDREINGLNEQLEEDSRTMSYLQLQLQQERNKRIQAERENKMLQSQVGMLMSMLNDAEEAVNNEEI